MIRTLMKQILSSALSCLLVIAAVPVELEGQQTTGYSGQGAPLSANELQQLVAPIALYPDSLVAQILGGATFPDQIVNANQFLQDNPSMTGQTLMYAVDAQSWDPSVKALTQFPSVLANMANNVTWTSSLGEAYHTQTSDVMSAVQTLRAKAYAAGNLKSGSQITVVQQSPQVIVIQPTNPQVVYVPQYNPTVVYGVPYTTPGYSTAAVVATGVLAFGAGIAVGAAMSGGCCGWSYSAWNCSWHGGAVVYGSSSYYGNNAWHGGYYGSSASAYGAYGSAHAGTAYNPSTGTYARGGYTTTPYGSQGAAQAYNPNTGAYGQTHQESNAYGSSGNSEFSKNGQTAYTQHQTTSQGSEGTVQTSNGGKAAAGTSANGNYAAGETANGNKYAESNGNVYKKSGSGWQQTQGSSSSHSGSSYSGTSGSSDYGHSGSSYSGSSSADSKGWGSQEKSGGSSMSGNGWSSRQDSSRGWSSRGGGGGGRR